MTIVIDCSVTIAWMLEDEATDRIIAIRDMVEVEGALVPAHWHLEVANALLMAERRGRFDRAYRTRRLAELALLPIKVDGSTAAEAWQTTLRHAELHKLTAYDAAYLELTLRSGLPLASLDVELNTAATRCGVEALLG